MLLGGRAARFLSRRELAARPPHPAAEVIAAPPRLLLGPRALHRTRYSTRHHEFGARRCRNSDGSPCYKPPAICGHSARIGVPRSAAPLHGAQRVAPSAPCCPRCWQSAPYSFRTRSMRYIPHDDQKATRTNLHAPVVGHAQPACARPRAERDASTARRHRPQRKSDYSPYRGRLRQLPHDVSALWTVRGAWQTNSLLPQPAVNLTSTLELGEFLE